MTEDKNETFESEIRLDGFLNWIWRGKWLIIFLAVVAGGAAYVMGSRQPTVHTASALIEVGHVWGKPLKDIYATVEIANSPGFEQDAASKTGLKPGQLARNVRVSAVESGVPHSSYPILIRVTAKSENADDATRFAQAVCDEIVSQHEAIFNQAMAPYLEQQRSLEQSLKESESSHAGRELAIKIKTQLDDVKANNTSPISTEKTRVVDKVAAGRAERPESVWRNAATAGLIGAIAGIAAACLWGYYKSPR